MNRGFRSPGCLQADAVLVLAGFAYAGLRLFAHYLRSFAAGIRETVVGTSAQRSSAKFRATSIRTDLEELVSCQRRHQQAGTNREVVDNSG